MPLLREEAEKLSNNTLEAGVIDEIIDRDDLFAVLPFMKVNSKAYMYNREDTLAGADFLDPNEEIKESASTFKEVVAKDNDEIRVLSKAILEADTEKIQRQLNIIMDRMISILDTKARDRQKENFYHGILLGLLGYKASWLIKSNTESGTSYSDILVEVPNNRTGIVIELKYSENGDMDAACDEALNQNEEKSYVDKLKQDVMRNFIKYGIACFKKDCKVVVSE